jgi:hypothetical protein
VLNTWAQGRARQVTLVTDKRNAYQVFIETAKRKRPPGRPRRRWVTNTQDFKYTKWQRKDPSGSGLGQVASCCEDDHEASGSIKCGEFLNWLRAYSFLKRLCHMKLDSQLVAAQLRYTIHTTLRYQNTQILTLRSLKALAPARHKSTVTDPLSYTVKTVCKISLCPYFVSTYAYISLNSLASVRFIDIPAQRVTGEAGGGGPVRANDPQIFCTNKGKAIPLQAWTDPEGSRRLKLPDFKAIGT